MIEAGLKVILEKCEDTWTPRDIYRRLKEERAYLFLGDGGFFIVEKNHDAHSFEPFLNVWCMYFEPGKGLEAEDALYESLEKIARDVRAEWVQFTSPRDEWEWMLRRKKKFKKHMITWRWYV